MSPRFFCRRRNSLATLLLLTAGLAAGLAGCGELPAKTAAPAQSEEVAAPSDDVSAQRKKGAQPTRETWDVVYLQGKRVGYVHAQTRPERRAGREVLVQSADTRLWLTRFGQATDQKIMVASNETPSGEVLDFVTEAQLGPAPMICRGRVEGNKLLIESTAGGKTVASELSWQSSTGGFSGLEQSLVRKPLEPGENRTLRVLLPMLNEVLVAEVELFAREYVATPLLTGEYELLAVDSVTRLPGGLRMESQLWVDRAGEILKTKMAAFEQETFRSTREVALEKVPEKPFDLGFDSVVPIAPALDDPHAAQQIRYRVELVDGDPASVFINGGTQSTRLLEPHAIELTVTRSLPDAPADPAIEAAPGPDSVAPNSLIQSNDPKIVELAADAVGTETDPWKSALAIEKFVHDHITQKGFGQAFATAAEVAASPEGDCTEHAVLLAAMARARGIPARVVTGLVYIGTPPGFGFHMWNEVYVAGRWIPVDATLARGGIGAGHIKIAHSNLSEATALGCFLPVAQVLGRLKIEVLEVK